MGDIFLGLGKFGLEENIPNNIFEDERNSSKQQASNQASGEIIPPKEEDFLLLKTMRCPVCDSTFRTVVIKSGKIKRLEPDLDLRQRYEYIDTNKYDVTSCPKCGYTAVNRYFPSLSSMQTKLIKENICAKLQHFPAKEIQEVETLDYDSAIERFKLALYVSIAKKGPASEKAYQCLKIAWLLRGKMEELSVDKEKNKDDIIRAHQEYQSFYSQAFDGFVKAMSSESFPMCGMDENTVDLIVAAMACNLEKYDFASRLVSGLIVSKTASGNVKNRARDLKDIILEKTSKNK